MKETGKDGLGWLPVVGARRLGPWRYDLSPEPLARAVSSRRYPSPPTTHNLITVAKLPIKKRQLFVRT
jgi:hypothetical protein